MNRLSVILIAIGFAGVFSAFLMLEFGHESIGDRFLFYGSMIVLSTSVVNILRAAWKLTTEK